MKRYLLFTFDDYYPAGGWDDFEEDFDSEAEAMKYLGTNNRGICLYQIVDTKTMEIVSNNYN